MMTKTEFRLNGESGYKTRHLHVRADRLVLMTGDDGVQSVEAEGNVWVELYDALGKRKCAGVAEEASYRPVDGEVTLMGWPRLIHANGADEAPAVPFAPMILKVGNDRVPVRQECDRVATRGRTLVSPRLGLTLAAV